MKTKSGIVVLSLLGLLVAGSAIAQSNVTLPPGYPEFRDPVTGKIWTPDNVSKDGQPVPFDDRAFEPRAQGGGVQGTVIQQVRPRVLGTVPITAGPTVPIVTVDAPALFAEPGNRWVTVLYLTNNSAVTVEPQLTCDFTNGAQLVMATRVITGPAGPGERIGMFVRGPRTDLFVNQVSCRVQAPG